MAVPAVNSTTPNFNADYIDLQQISTPANPPAGTRRLFIDSADGQFKVRTSSGVSEALEGAGGGGPWTTVKKTADEIVNNSAALQDDNHLLFNAVANTNYAFRIVVFFDTTAAADFVFELDGPASPTLIRYETTSFAPGGFSSTVNTQTAYQAQLAVTGDGADGGYISIEGILKNGANAGNVRFRWAQNTATAVDTTVRLGSYLEYMSI